MDTIVIASQDACNQPEPNIAANPAARTDRCSDNTVCYDNHLDMLSSPRPSFRSLSSIHRLTVFLDSARIHALLQRFSLSILSSRPSRLAPLSTPLCGINPQSSHTRMTVPQHDQMSSYSTSNRRYQSGGNGMRRRRVVRRMEATARVCGGWTA